MQQIETDERWYVQFDSGEVQLMTLEELDAAFDAGEVHENTFVIQVGETQWQTLADVAGLSDEEEPVELDAELEAELEPEADPETTTLYAPAHAASMHAAAQVPAQRAPAPAPAPAQRAPAPGPSVRPAVAVAAGGWPPVAVAAAPQSTWPPVVASRPSGGYNLGPQSVIPVVSDLDFDVPSFKSGRKNAVIAAFAVIPALAGGGYALTRLDMPPDTRAAAAPAPVQTSKPWVPPPPTPTPAAAPTPPPSEAKSDSGSTGKLSDDMKKALLASDSSRSPKAKAKSAAPARSTAASSKKGSSVFKAGGSSNDPLNSKL